GAGSGFLWRADTFSTYVEGDNGVYMGFETVGLSRTIPALLGWIVEPIARRLARASAAETLLRQREAILTPGPASPIPSFDIPEFGCTGSNVSCSESRQRGRIGRRIRVLCGGGWCELTPQCILARAIRRSILST